MGRVGIFAKSGEFWTLGLDGTAFTIRDFRGLTYIQRLLRHPGHEFHAIDLQGSAGGESSLTARSLEATQVSMPLDRGDAGVMLDTQAKTEYKRRLAELREDLEEAREKGALDRVDKLESEIEFLAREVSRAVGLGGRDRRAASSSERARLAVTRAINVATQRASSQHAPLGRLLQLCIKTGTFCSCNTNPDTQVDWQFSVATSGPIPVGMGTDSSTPVENAVSRSEFWWKTLFVGRHKERSLLASCLDEVASGRGRIAMIGGTAGVGKSRLAGEIAKEAERRGMEVLVGSCRDREDPLAYGPFVEIIETALSRAASAELFRGLIGPNAPDLARIVPQLRRVMPDLPPSSDLPPEQSRHLMFTGIADVLARFAARRATVLLLEDLHWADEATLLLLTFLASRFVSTPVLILGTYRDFAAQPDRPLTRALEDLMRSRTIQEVGLEGLSEGAVAEMLHGLSGREIPAQIVSLIYAQTDGNPFFVEELFQHLVEHGKFAGTERPEQPLEIADITVPQSVRLVIGRRLASLTAITQKALGIAAVIGRSFAFDLLEASNKGGSAESLLDGLDEAEAAGLIQSTPNQEAEYKFSHELTRQTAFSALSVPRRQRLHLQVADAIEHLYEGNLEEHASDLAHHLWQAGSSAQPARTIHSLAMAAKQEIAQNAFESTLRHLRNARELLKKLPDSAERGVRELDIQIDCANALVVTRGNYAPEVREAYKRARELSLKFANSELQPFSIAFGLWMFHISKGEHVTARSYADEMLEMAQRAEDDGMMAGAHSVLGNSQFYMGEFTAAHASYQQGLARYDPKEHRKLARRFGQDAGLGCLCYDAMALWVLGFPNQAEKRAEEAVAFARRVEEPFDLAWCMGQLTMYYQLRLDLERAEAIIEEGLAVATKYGFSQSQTALKIMRIIGLSLKGKTSREMVAGLGGEGKAPYELAGTWGRAAVAGALVAAGRVDAAEMVLNQAREMMERNGERYFEAEIYRTDGEISLKRAESGDHLKQREAALNRAEQSFTRALDAARTQNAKIFELRAAVSLGRLMIRKGRVGEAVALIQGVYDWFTEGFDSPELIAARSMLDGLGSADETGASRRRLHIVR